MYQRLIGLPRVPKHSFFLWGPRQTGKTTLLETKYPDTLFISLLLNRELTTLASRPETLGERIRDTKAKFVIIDEVQKIPELLDEIHFLIEKHKIIFGLCGSSVRKIKRAHANLLGGRAIRFHLFGMTAKELGTEFNLNRILNRGILPKIYDETKFDPLLTAYCADYLKEEIFDEGLVRKLTPFSKFLEFAALSDTEVLSFESFARDVGVSGPTIRSYFEILSDTLIGQLLPPYTHRPKRKLVLQSKFYFFDVGIVNSLAQRGELKERSELYGKAFENWVHHELQCYLAYSGKSERLSYWKVHQGPEVDFIVGSMKVAIEAKASSKIHSEHLKGLREIKKDHPELRSRYVVSLEPYSRQTEDGITILSYIDFIDRLWKNLLW